MLIRYPLKDGPSGSSDHRQPIAPEGPPAVRASRRWEDFTQQARSPRDKTRDWVGRGGPFRLRLRVRSGGPCHDPPSRSSCGSRICNLIILIHNGDGGVPPMETLAIRQPDIPCDRARDGNAGDGCGISPSRPEYLVTHIPAGTHHQLNPHAKASHTVSYNPWKYQWIIASMLTISGRSHRPEASRSGRAPARNEPSLAETPARNEPSLAKTAVERPHIPRRM